MRAETHFSLCAWVLVGSGCVVGFEDEEPAASVGFDTLAEVTEADGRCPVGGVVVVVGVDSDGSGALTDDERTGGETVLCSETAGEDAQALLMHVVDVTPGAACANGGVVVTSGRDSDGDDTLDANEVDETSTFCHANVGDTGHDALVEIDAAPDGDCPAAGLRARFGQDVDDDTVLDAGEVVGVAIACDGVDGAAGGTGTSGGAALVVTEEVGNGVLCPAGGHRVQVGTDDDADQSLSTDEIQLSAVVCNGRTLTGGGGLPIDPGASEGTPLVPVVVDVTLFDPASGAHLGQVAAGDMSVYSFTTPPDADVAPYTLAFHDISSDVDVSLFDTPNFLLDEVPLACVFDAARVYTCATPPLAANTERFVRVQETHNLALTYALTVSFGARTGTGSSPSTSGSDRSVHGGGRSVFVVPTGLPRVRTIRVGNIRGAPLANPVLEWMLLDGPGPSAESDICTQDEQGVLACAVADVGGSLVAVRETSGQGALFDLFFEDDDTVTPEIVLDAANALEAAQNEQHVLTFETPVAGPYTFSFVRAPGASTGDFSMHASFFAAREDQDPIVSCWSTCIADVPAAYAGSRLYLRVPVRTFGAVLGTHQFVFSPRAGNEGVVGTPLPLAVQSTHAGSALNISYYQMSGIAPGTRTSIGVDGYGVTDFNCRFFTSADFTTETWAQTHSNAELRGCVTERSIDGSDVFVQFYRGNSLNNAGIATFALTLAEGDVVTPTLVADTGPEIAPLVFTTQGGRTFRRLVVPKPGPYRVVTTTTDLAQRRVFNAHPRNTVGSSAYDYCETSTGNTAHATAPCVLRFVERPNEDRYLQLYRGYNTVADVTVTLEAEPITTLTLDVPEAVNLPGTTSTQNGLWLAVDLDVPRSLTLDITPTATVSYSVDREDETFTTTIVVAGGQSNTGGVLRQISLGALAAGRHHIHIRTFATVSHDFTVMLSETP